MRKTTVALIAVSSGLVITNAAWLYAAFDAGVSHTYLADSYLVAQATANQAIELLPVVARPGANRESIIAEAMRGHDASEVFEKEGFTWIGELGLRFDSAGVLVDVQPATDPL